MPRMLLPAVLGLVAIVSLSFYEGFAMKDRWGEPGVEAKELGERFAQVPLDIGEWEGEDLPVDEVVRQTAGAIGYVSRRYTNVTTGKQVVLWLIVGHSRDVTRHTPNICYPSQGFRQVSSQMQHRVKMSDGIEAKFYTAKFEKVDAFSRNIDRVFWTFNHPDTNKWESPDEGPRWHYGLAKAIYKLYFTSAVQSDEDTIEENVATEFAVEMLPAINAALFPTEVSEASSSTPAIEADGVESDGVESDVANKP